VGRGGFGGGAPGGVGGSFAPSSAAGGTAGAPAGAPGAGSAQALFGDSGAAGAGASGASAGRIPGGGFGAGGIGGSGTSVSSALAKALEADAGSYRWVAATSGSSTAASYELATGGEPVMALGGFNGNGGDLSLASFIAYVHAGDIHYFIAAGGGGGGPGGGAAGTTSAITAWVEQHFSAETIGGVTVYDLSR
jgi:hypothetical protein